MKLPKEVKDDRGRRCLFVWLQMDRFLEPRILSLFASHRMIVYEIKNRFNPQRYSGRRYVKDEKKHRNLRRQYDEPRTRFEYPEGFQPTITEVRTDSEGGSADTYELEGDLVRPCEKLFDDLRNPSESWTIVNQRASYEYPIKIKDERGPPLNPEGRTGAIGLGELKRFGPNHAVDLCVTRRDPQTPELADPGTQNHQARRGGPPPQGRVQVARQANQTR